MQTRTETDTEINRHYPMSYLTEKKAVKREPEIDRMKLEEMPAMNNSNSKL